MAQKQPLHQPGMAKKRPVHQADMAQARVFEVILEDEIHELEGLIEALSARCGAIGGHKPVPELRTLQSRLAEVQRLLCALRNRFP